MGLSDQHTVNTLLPGHLARAAGLPPTLHLNDDVLLAHGTPATDLEYFLETVTEDELRAATPAEVGQRAGDTDAAVILNFPTPRSST